MWKPNSEFFQDKHSNLSWLARDPRVRAQNQDSFSWLPQPAFHPKNTLKTWACLWSPQKHIQTARNDSELHDMEENRVGSRAALVRNKAEPTHICKRLLRQWQTWAKGEDYSYFIITLEKELKTLSCIIS